MNVERILILEKGSFCHYNPMLDLIVISECYRKDPDFFEYALEHERRHRRIHLKYGYLGVLHHAALDWEHRFTFMTSNYSNFKKFVNLANDNSEQTKNSVTQIVYIFLTLPTMVFQWVGRFRMFFDWILGGIRWLIRVILE